MFLLTLLLLTKSAYSDEGVPLKKGEKAPFNGTLLSPDAVAQIIAKTDEEVGKCKIDAELDKKLTEADFKLQLKLKEAELTGCLEKSQGLEALRADQIAFLEKQVYQPKWKPSAIYITGVLSGIGVVYLTTKIVEQQ